MTEPRTEAGRDAMRFLQTHAWLEAILAIEAQARADALDVEVLAQAITEAAPSRPGIHAEAEAIAREYRAILSERKP